MVSPADRRDPVPGPGRRAVSPPAVFQELRDLRPFAENLETYECIAHPDLKGEARASFTLASLVYRVIAGRFPVTGKDGEEVHEQARKLAITPPDQVVPELVPEVSELVMAGLARGRRPQPKLEEWAASLDAWQRKEVFRTLGAEEKAKALRDREAQETGSAKSFRRRMFWEKNWKLVGIIAIVVIVVGAIGGSMLKNVLAPRVTKGYSPQKIVETFYTSMNALDHMTMEACVIGKAGQGEINEATTLYVTSRVVMGYEGASNIVSAAAWDAAGRPDLVSPQTLYGVTALTVRQEQGAPAPVFLVSYDKWNPLGAPDTGAAPDMNAIPLSEGHAMQDRVFLKQDKGDWVIYRIDRLKADPLPAPKVVPAPAAGAGGRDRRHARPAGLAIGSMGGLRGAPIGGKLPGITLDTLRARLRSLQAEELLDLLPPSAWTAGRPGASWKWRRRRKPGASLPRRGAPGRARRQAPRSSSPRHRRCPRPPPRRPARARRGLPGEQMLPSAPEGHDEAAHSPGERQPRLAAPGIVAGAAPGSRQAASSLRLQMRKSTPRRDAVHGRRVRVGARFQSTVCRRGARLDELLRCLLGHLVLEQRDAVSPGGRGRAHPLRAELRVRARGDRDGVLPRLVDGDLGDAGGHAGKEAHPRRLDTRRLQAGDPLPAECVVTEAAVHLHLGARASAAATAWLAPLPPGKRA